MLDRANIKTTVKPVMFGDGGRASFDYEWEGDPTAPVLINSRMAADLPWPMALIEENYLMRGGWYIRLDVRGAWYRRGWLIAVRRVSRAWEWFTARCVLTLHVWGLASYEPGRIPSWRDVGIRKGR